MIIADEVYERLCFKNSLPRIACINPRVAQMTVSIGSVGKSLNATGWRVGYVIGLSHLITPIRLASHALSYVASGPAQAAAAVGLREAHRAGFWDANRDRIRRKIDRLS